MNATASCGLVKRSHGRCTVVHRVLDALSPTQSAAAQARWSKRRNSICACKRACIHCSAHFVSSSVACTELRTRGHHGGACGAYAHRDHSAICRRELTTASETRAAISREATGSLAPIQIGFGPIALATVVRKGATPRGTPRSTTASKTVVRWLRRQKKYASAPAMLAKALLLPSPQAKRHKSSGRAQVTTVSRACGSGIVHGVSAPW